MQEPITLPIWRADRARFYSKLPGPRDPDACWPWSRGKSRGYGRFWLQDETRPAHVVAWVMEYGLVPEGTHVLHTCGRMDCCNPRHLRLGRANATDGENREQRFLAKVVVTDTYPNSLDTPCWQWTGCADQDGHAKMRLEGRLRLATHVSWYIYNGGWPTDSSLVLHSCGNSWCVNPGHLYLGTPADAGQERVDQGRTAKGEKNGAYTKPDRVPRGERNGRSKLTAPDVVMIRRTCDNYPGRHGLYAFLGRMFQVGVDVISDIGRRKTWKCVPEGTYPEIVALPPEQVQCGRLSGEKCEHSTITDLTYREIRFLFAQCDGRHGALSALARRYGIGVTSVKRIVERKDRQDLADNFGEIGCCEPLFPDW